ncbi:MAG: hypothetical protein AB1755_05175 [Candidatus Omnitrophota bacterium]
MKKVAIIVQDKDKEDALINLRGLGVLHVEMQNVVSSSNITSLEADLSLINQALEVLAEFEVYENCKAIHLEREITDWKISARHIIDSWKRIDHLEEYSKQLLHKIDQWRLWGDFDIEQIHSLAKKNIFVKLYQVPANELNKFPSNLIIEKISTKAAIVNCLVIATAMPDGPRLRREASRQENIDVPFKEVSLPQMRLSAMIERKDEDAKTISLLRADLHKYTCFNEYFLKVKSRLEKELEFQKVLCASGKKEVFSYFVGFVPSDLTNKITERAKIKKWAILINDPTDEDVIPTLVRNPKWVSIIEPVFKLVEIVPGYHELDISRIFLIFFSIFFGMIIGDAGYGLVYLLITFSIQKKRKFNKNEKQIFFLFYILIGCAIIWGLLTGTFFGQSWLPKTIKPLAPALNNTNVLQTFCFFLGALHLSLAHLWRAIIKLPSLAALVDIGWILVLWVVFFLAKALILGDSFPAAAKWMLLSGVIFVVLFTSPQKNILKAIGAGLGNLALTIMNNFTDVVSYVRLFAVGLASVAVADTFNLMASSINWQANIINLIVAVFILIVGHGLNLILGPMSVLVHGIRLNVLEFCSHADIKWLGFSYRPLKED